MTSSHALALVLVIPWTLGAAPPDRTVNEAAWQRAERVVIEHYRAKGHDPVQVVERFPRWPFLMRLFVDDAWRAYDLVDGDRLVTERGLAPLGRYLDGQDVWSAPALSASDLLDVVHVFDAWPALDPEDGYGDRTDYATDGGLEESLPPPRLTRDRDQLQLVLHYRIHMPRRRRPGLLDDEGPPDEPSLRRAGRWTLTLRRGRGGEWAGTLLDTPRQ